jgi:hypothetical protein
VIEIEQLETLLSGLAAAFEDVEKRPESVSSARGWGQFLDGSTSHQQIGLYGTSAGILVRALASRGKSQLTDEVADFVRHWWSHRETDAKIREFLGQTTRLAFLNLALRLSHIVDEDGIKGEVEQELLRRLLPNDMWGDYFFSHVQDPTPRLFPSAVALLSFTLMRQPNSSLDQRLLRVADQLEGKLLGYSRLPMLHAATAATAILATKGQAIGRKVRKRITAMAYAGQADMADLGVYFYDYEYPDEKGTRKFGRDYFIVPPEMMIAIAGFQTGAPSSLRLRAESSVMSLVNNLKEHGGKYRPDDEQRVSSKNQAWGALVLKLSSSEHVPVKLHEKLWYELRRSRSENWFTRWVVPSLCLFDIVLAQFAQNLGSSPKALVLKILTPLLALLTGRLYGRTVFPKLFPGREW